MATKKAAAGNRFGFLSAVMWEDEGSQRRAGRALASEIGLRTPSSILGRCPHGAVVRASMRTAARAKNGQGSSLGASSVSGEAAPDLGVRIGCSHPSDGQLGTSAERRGLESREGEGEGG